MPKPVQPVTVHRKIRIQNELGLHLRPLGKFVKIAEKYTDCDLVVTHDGIEADGKSIVGLLMLAAAKGSVIELAATGKGAERLLDELEALAKEGFGE